MATENRFHRQKQAYPFIDNSLNLILALSPSQGTLENAGVVFPICLRFLHRVPLVPVSVFSPRFWLFLIRIFTGCASSWTLLGCQGAEG